MKDSVNNHVYMLRIKNFGFRTEAARILKSSQDAKHSSLHHKIRRDYPLEGAETLHHI